MLPKFARITTPADFSRVTKSGMRATTESFVAYLYIQPALTTAQPRAGLIVGKSVGGSVQRHRLSRQLRHAIAPELMRFPQGSMLVIRALKEKTKSEKTESVGRKSVESQIEKLFLELLRKSEKFTRKVEI